MTFQITTPYFVAGIVTDGTGTIVQAAPILRWARGRSLEWLDHYCRRRHWVLAPVDVRA